MERKQRCFLPWGGHHIQSVYEFNSFRAATVVIDHFFIEDSPVVQQIAVSSFSKHLQATVTIAKDRKEALETIRSQVQLRDPTDPRDLDKVHGRGMF
jgi:hypothetical protein